MKLFEILDVRTSRRDYNKFVDRALGIAGKKGRPTPFDRTGGSSDLYDHPKKPANAVVKDVTITKDHSKDGYLAWLKFCVNNQDNPYLPKIYGSKIFVNHASYSSDKMLVSMERLRQTDHTSLDVRAKYLYMMDVESWTDLDRMDSLVKARDSAAKKDKQLAQVLDAMAKLSNQGYRPDMGSNNVMFRGNQLVFIDPFGSKS